LRTTGLDGGGVAAGPFSGPGDKGQSAFANLTRSTITHNAAGHDGGGLYSIKGAVNAYDSVISRNTAAHTGGAYAQTDVGAVGTNNSAVVFNSP
jgi:hypothetical protein